ncbi:MAG: DNA polymerase III subunit beta [Legionellales bacterium]
MFQLSIKKEDILPPLLNIAGAVDKKQTVGILSNFLLKLSNGLLSLTATDLELEMSAQVACESADCSGSVTVPARKFIDIIRSLDDHVGLHILYKDELLTIKQGRSSFRLSTLAADNYPISKDEFNNIELTLPRLALLKVIQSTYFAMSQQDVRVFLNGLFLEFETNYIVAVAADGHRMAINRYVCSNESQSKLLLPRKGVHELLRLLNHISDDNVLLYAGQSHFKLVTQQFVFLSKLIESRFPPYNKAIPREQDKFLIIDCALLKRSLARIVILAHEKSKAVMLHLQAGQVTLIANNNEQEEAVDTLPAETQGEEIKIGLNASYLLDVLNYFSDGQVKLSFSSTDSSMLIEFLLDDNYKYIIMPMKI